MKKLSVITVTVFAAAFCLSSLAADKKAEQSAVRAADQDWLKVFAAKDLDKSVAMCDEAGAVLAPNAPSSEGRAAIAKSFAAFFALPDFKISWTPTKVDVANSDDLAYTSGTYEFSFADQSGKTIPDHGKYVTVWKKQKGGSWKVLLDIFNTDMPPAGM